MKTLTMCGSMRFAEEMKNIAFILEIKYGFNILQCIYDDGTELTCNESENIIKAHYRKIDISDGIYVVDIDGYIGKSVEEEIKYAQLKGKEVLYHSNFR